MENYRLDALENRIAEVLAEKFTVNELEKIFSVSSIEQWEEILSMAMNEIENNEEVEDVEDDNR